MSDIINNNKQYKYIMEKNKINLQNILNKVQSLDKNEYIEIFKIIRRNENIKYSENNNGIFINLSLVDKKTLKQINDFIDFCHVNIENMKTIENNICEEKKKFFKSDEDKVVQEKKKNINITNTTNTTKIPDENIPIKYIINKNKPKYSGLKSKVLRHYRDINNTSRYNTNISLTIKKNKSVNKDVIKEKNIEKNKEPIYEQSIDGYISEEEEDDEEYISDEEIIDDQGDYNLNDEEDNEEIEDNEEEDDPEIEESDNEEEEYEDDDE